MKDIVLAALLVRPSVVVLPDFLFDSHRTLDELENALKSPPMKLLLSVMPDVKLMAVIQGVDPADWLECFHILNDPHSGIDMLGIPMLTTQLFGSRSEALRKIARRVKKQCHLLGFWHGVPLSQVEEEKKFDFVTGIDTCKPVKLAVRGKTLAEWTSLEHDRSFIDTRHENVNLELLRLNCEGFVEACT
jgi:hypothetical protein